VVKILGKKGDKITESEIILHEFGVPHENFTAEVMACLPPDGWAISEKDMHHRSDFRHLPIASVDPPGCKDIDDALHCIKLPNGHYQVGVHIADVSYFVLPDSPLDLEAAKRCTSTYLVEKRLDMLPSLLTTQLCSLRSDEDHLAFSVLWEMDENANIFDVQFKKSIIRSVASLTYDQAQVILDGNSSPNESLNQSIRMLNHFARILRKTRNDNGALTLVSPEVRFKLDEDSRDPTDVMMYNLKEANAMVEEWMLLANITVAKKILKHYPTLSILRRHQPPSIDQLRPLQLSAKAAGFNLNLSNSKSLSDSLDAAVMPEDPYFNKLLRIIATRCMMPAQYFCSGELAKEQWHHYGLAAPVYTHFTSPIRRYADVRLMVTFD
jgi:exosome complex exonuclease DIS3/RRP44